MRVSREVTKERLLELVEGAIIDVEESGSGIITTEAMAKQVADEVWQMLGELDDEDDLGILKLQEEDLEQGG